MSIRYLSPCLFATLCLFSSEQIRLEEDGQSLVASWLFVADDLQSIAGPKQVPKEETQPPAQENSDSEQVVASQGRTLILSRERHPDLSHVSQDEKVVIIDLDVPGRANQLIKQLEPLFFNQPLTQENINLIKRTIIRYYREHSHPVVMVYVPEQKIKNGVLQIVVVEGRVGKVAVTGNQYTSSERIKKSIHLQHGDTINETRLLRDVSWINTNPFRSASVLYLPGEEKGTTDVELKIRDRRPWRVYGGGDNTGSKFTGLARWFIGCNFENFFIPDHLFSFQYMTSNDFHKFQSYTGQYILPFSWRHTLSVFGGYATVHPGISNFRESTGKSYQGSGRYEIPLWGTYPHCPQQLTVGFDFKGTNNNLIFGQDNITTVQKTIVNIAQFIFGYHLSWDHRQQKIAFGTDVFWEPGKLVSHQTDADFKSLNPHATPKYVYGRLSYTHDIPLLWSWSLFLQGRLQVSDASLLASEQFGLGGYNTVRGYPERSVNGDNAVCGNLELRTPPFRFLSYFFKVPQDDLYFLAFTDYGHAWDHKKIPGFPLEQTLLSYGPGLRYRMSSWCIARLDLGFPTYGIQGAKKEPRIDVSVVLSY